MFDSTLFAVFCKAYQRSRVRSEHAIKQSPMPSVAQRLARHSDEFAVRDAHTAAYNFMHGSTVSAGNHIYNITMEQ